MKMSLTWAFDMGMSINWIFGEFLLGWTFGIGMSLDWALKYSVLCNASLLCN